jgi:alkanesulfonate monooxygenase SsuD/methylene tetrahydromethanopterin reductase-like flavin-dependent oxidoreductase (luciferase family)
MNFGLLDFGDIQAGSNAISTIHDMLEMAQLAEELGFTKYWLSEHHEDGMAWKNPDILLPLLAGYTNTINVGSAGVLVGLNTPVNTAYHYKLLANLYPSRIDLGLAKGKTETHKCEALADGSNWQKNLNDYYPRIKTIKALIKDEIIDNILPPQHGESPNFWILSTSKSSISFVVEEQMNFSLSLFHTLDQPSPEIITSLKEAYFEKNKVFPKINIAITAFCSDDSKRIEHIKEVTKGFQVNFANSPDLLLDYLNKLGQKYTVDEIIIVNLGQTTDEKLLLMNVFKEYVTASQLQ